MKMLYRCKKSVSGLSKINFFSRSFSGGTSLKKGTSRKERKSLPQGATKHTKDSRNWIGRRETHDTSAVLVRELAMEGIRRYKIDLQLIQGNFEKFLDLVAPKMKREDDNERCYITKSKTWCDFKVPSNWQPTTKWQPLYQVPCTWLNLFCLYK